MIVSYFHFSFTVSNLERSLAFYVDLLGMRLVGTQIHDQPYTSVQVGFPNAVLKAARLTIEGLPPVRSGHLLELIEYVKSLQGPANEAVRPATGGPAPNENTPAQTPPTRN